VEQKYHSSQVELRGTLDSVESELAKTKESLEVAEQTALSIEAR
jgi:hypothetical protein